MTVRGGRASSLPAAETAWGSAEFSFPPGGRASYRPGRSVVTGVAGRLAQLAVGHLVRRVRAAEVVGTSRTPEKAAGLPVEVRAADFGDPGSLVTAFDGADVGYVTEDDSAAVAAAALADFLTSHRAAPLAD
ncbi:hypothetical protein ACIREK_28010 [Streptomyces sp. NPDC102415]|uniref:hypothetical protein n=1 Tax=Streptomyces sp. NPDC102415 TaxID=3366173 RepID=UPI0037FB4744